MEDRPASSGKPATEPALEQYRGKRRVGATPEPFGRSRVTGGSIFVVHHHLARREHYDLRLEVDGTLWSWAVPKGPSPDPADKRLAVHTEPHPIDYAWFEDTIPEGNYGAGAMVVWDRGRWVPKIEPHEGLAAGKLLFELQGFKLHGLWALVRTRQDWLLIKEQDEWVGRYPPMPAGSVVSGLSAQELRDGQDRAARLARAVRRAGARSLPSSPRLAPMLCEPSAPFSDDDWLFEIKYDGYRLLAERQGERVALRTRRGRDVSRNFPEITEAVAALPHEHFVVDGEVVVSDAAGMPSFARLQQRGQLQRAADIARAAVLLPATFEVFDLLVYDGSDLRPLPLEKRKSLLRRLLPEAGYLRYVDHVVGAGEALYEQAERMGLEGLVAKRRASAYQGCRSTDWRKIAALDTDDFAVIGYTPAKSDGSSLGAVHLAGFSNGRWVPVGRAGSGLDHATRDRLLAALREAERGEPVAPVAGAPAGSRWVEPEQVVEVRYKQFTTDGNLRQPVLLRWRDDKAVSECIRVPAADAVEPAVVTESVSRERVIVSNRDKVFWPDSGATKGDLIDYYRGISKWMLPYLADRPVVLTRYPDGIEGKSFYQHRAPDFLPEWIRREKIWNESDEEEREYIIVDDEDTLLYLANLGTIPIHVWNASAANLQRVDWCVLDLDPKEAPFADVVKVARDIHDICQRCGIPHFLKTSGSSGLHVLIPANRQLTHDQSKELGELIARVCVARLPQVATIQRHVKLRAGRVYIDYLQNGHGKTIAAPFCVRPLPGAPVSMPLRWSELGPRAEPARYHIGNARRRMGALGEDPLAGVLTARLDIAAALAGLAGLLG